MPSFSLGARQELPGDTTRKPGPGAHCPENVSSNKSGDPPSIPNANTDD